MATEPSQDRSSSPWDITDTPSRFSNALIFGNDERSATHARRSDYHDDKDHGSPSSRLSDFNYGDDGSNARFSNVQVSDGAQRYARSSNAMLHADARGSLMTTSDMSVASTYQTPADLSNNATSDSSTAQASATTVGLTGAKSYSWPSDAEDINSILHSVEIACSKAITAASLIVAKINQQ